MQGQRPKRHPFSNVQAVTGAESGVQVMNPATVALGRLDGLKGGKARAESLNKKLRGEITRLAQKRAAVKNKS